MANFFKKSMMTLSLLIFIVGPLTAAEVVPAPVENDFLKLLDSLGSYNQTSDLAIVAPYKSSFYNGDAQIDAALQKNATEAMNQYSQNPNAAQSDATKILIQSMTDAYKALQAKLEMQKKAAKAFEDGGKEATNLDKIEKAQEKKCTQAIASALAAGNSVNDECNNLKSDDDKKSCGDELNACASKINADLDMFNAYLAKREKLQPSKAGFAEVSAEADNISANFPGTAQVCNHYSAKMARIEESGSCISKVKNDEKNEAYQGQSVDTKALGINANLDSNMLTPKHRIGGFAKLKQMADAKILETQTAMEKIQENVKKLGGVDLAKGVGVDSSSADDEGVGILTNNGTTVPVSVIKSFFASNPSPEAILNEAARLGLTKNQIAHAMNIGGYGGEKPSDPNNFAQTKALESKFEAQIEQFVASKGGDFSGSQGSIRVPGVSQVDATKNVMSNKGWITPEQVKQFLDTNPTDQQFFAKMAELGLRKSDIATILNGQGLLYKDGNPTQVLLNDTKFGSIYNRLNNELYQGTTGYGEADTYDPYSLIVKGTGHVMDEDNKVWIPFGFKSSKTQHVDTRNQAPTPVSFTSGGQFGVASAIGNNHTKVVKESELKRLRSK